MHTDITRRQLLARGWTAHGIAAAVHRGELVRVRQGHYCTPGVSEEIQQAVRIGGRATCLTALRAQGVWVADDERRHVHLAPNASRLRQAEDASRRWVQDPAWVLHWTDLVDETAASPGRVGTVNALAHASECLPAWEWLASVDSALHMGLLDSAGLQRLAAALPARVAKILARADPAAESGIETIVRELCRALGFKVQVQVPFPGIGRVDLVIEDAVVIETDGAEFHGAEVTSRDRRRDAALTARGRTVLHFRFAQVMYERAALAAAVIEAVRSHRSIPKSGQKADRARKRAERLNLA